MINIISTQASKTNISGPGKVFANLVKGLDKIGYPYVVNRDLNATKRLWLHDDVSALRYMHRSKAYKVLGPNLFVLPAQIPPGIQFNGTLYLHPCEWTANLWEHIGFNACPIKPWPVGIDTDEFHASGVSQAKHRVMVYHKQRYVQDLPIITKQLNKMKLKYWLVLYPLYDEKEYKELLNKTSFIIWHGGHESQGIALQEAMACDIPILVLDAESLFFYPGASKYFDKSLKDFPVTSVPYFNDTCGVKITDPSQLKSAIEFMMDNLNNFSPREFVLKHLSLEGQARAFVSLWEHWGLRFEEGLHEKLLSRKMYSIPMKNRLFNLARKMRRTL